MFASEDKGGVDDMMTQARKWRKKGETAGRERYQGATTESAKIDRQHVCPLEKKVVQKARNHCGRT